MKAKITSNWIMKSLLGFKIFKNEEIRFPKNNSQIVWMDISEILFLKVPKNDDRNRADVSITQYVKLITVLS